MYSAGGNKTALYVHTELVSAAVRTLLMGNVNDNITVPRHRVHQGWKELRIKINYMVTNIYIDTSICLGLYSSCGPWQLFQFLNLCIFGRTSWTGD
jgi:hypothetical protein